jgi:acyl-CoA dehydrogenase
MDTPLHTADDIDSRLVREMADRFAASELGAWCERPEQVPGREDSESLVAAARRAGILAGEAGPGCLWDGPVRDSLVILERLAARHAGMAYQLHQLALGEWLSARIGLAPGDDALVPWLPDGQAIAEIALVNFMVNGRVDPALAALLPEPGAAIHWHCAEPWDALFTPVVLDGTVRLCLVPRQAFAGESVSAHGLDGVSLCRASLPEIAIAQAPPAIGADMLAELLGLNALGLMAIALGVVRTAHGRALQQASLRQQGGCLIEQHPAVQGLLAEQESAMHVVESLLAAHTQVPATLAELRRTFSHRLVAHRLLCAAANAAMQVFGGSGYMRDVGLERAVRDCNRLRVLAGAPADLGLFVVRASQALAA